MLGEAFDRKGEPFGCFCHISHFKIGNGLGGLSVIGNVVSFEESNRLRTSYGKVDVLRYVPSEPQRRDCVQLRFHDANNIAARVQQRTATVAGLNRGADL